MAKTLYHWRPLMQPSKLYPPRLCTPLTCVAQTCILRHVLAHYHASCRRVDDFRCTQQDKHRPDADYAPIEHGRFETPNGTFGFHGRVMFCQHVD